MTFAEQYFVYPSVGDKPMRLNYAGDSKLLLAATRLAAGYFRPTTLYLYKCELTGVGFEALASALAVCRGLHTIDVSYCRINETGIHSLSKLITPDLMKLTLGSLDIGDAGAKVLAKALQRSGALIYLYLCYCQIGFVGIEFIANAIHTHSNLATLTISSNNIGCAGASALGTMLYANRKLTQLDASSCGIGSLGAEFLSEAICKNHTLRRLDLSHNPIGDTGAMALVGSLSSGAPIVKLVLNDCQIKDKGAFAIAQAIVDNTTLFALWMFGNKIDLDCIAALSEALRHNYTLTCISVDCVVRGSETHMAVCDEETTKNRHIQELLRPFKRQLQPLAAAVAPYSACASKDDELMWEAGTQLLRRMLKYCLY